MAFLAASLKLCRTESYEKLKIVRRLDVGLDGPRQYPDPDYLEKPDISAIYTGRNWPDQTTDRLITGYPVRP